MFELASLETQNSAHLNIDASASKKVKSKTRTPSNFGPYPYWCSVQDYGSFGRFPKSGMKKQIKN